MASVIEGGRVEDVRPGDVLTCAGSGTGDGHDAPPPGKLQGIRLLRQPRRSASEVLLAQLTISAFKHCPG